MANDKLKLVSAESKLIVDMQSMDLLRLLDIIDNSDSISEVEKAKEAVEEQLAVSVIGISMMCDHYGLDVDRIIAKSQHVMDILN